MAKLSGLDAGASALDLSTQPANIDKAYRSGGDTTINLFNPILNLSGGTQGSGRFGGGDGFDTALAQLVASSANTVGTTPAARGTDPAKGLDGFLDQIADALGEVEIDTADQTLAVALNGVEDQARSLIGAKEGGLAGLKALASAVSAAAGQASAPGDKTALNAIAESLAKRIGAVTGKPTDNPLDAIADRLGLAANASTDQGFATRLNGLENRVRALIGGGATAANLDAIADDIGRAAKGAPTAALGKELNAIEKLVRAQIPAPEATKPETPKPDAKPVEPTFKRPTPPPFPNVKERGKLDEAAVNGVDQKLLTTETYERATITFQADNAGYNNSLIAYQIKDDGTIDKARVVLASTDSAKKGDQIDLGVFEPGAKIGFALVANGAKNGITGEGSIAFKGAGGKPFNINDGAQPQVIFKGSDGKEREITAPTFLTSDPTNGANNPLNDGGNGQAIAGSNGQGGLRIGFEDLIRGDNDFNDLIFDVSFTKVEPPSSQELSSILGQLADRVGALAKAVNVPIHGEKYGALAAEVRKLATPDKLPKGDEIEALAAKFDAVAAGSTDSRIKLWAADAAGDLRRAFNTLLQGAKPAAEAAGSSSGLGARFDTIAAALNTLASQVKDPGVKQQIQSIARQVDKLDGKATAAQIDTVADALGRVATKTGEAPVAAEANRLEGQLRSLQQTAKAG